MPTPLIITREGCAQTSSAHIHAMLRAIVKTECRRRTGAVTPLTNNSGGTAGTVTAVGTLTNVAASGSNLADKTTSEAEFNKVLDALKELWVKVNATSAVLAGISTVTDNGGGSATDGTIGVITPGNVTGAATGCVAASLNPMITGMNTSIYNLGTYVNKLANATGVSPVVLGYSQSILTTIPAITVSGGTAASPGVTQTAVQAALTTLQNNVKTLAATLITINTAAVPLIIAQ